MKTTLGVLLAFAIGSVCRLSGIPSPAPPAIVGALLVLSMTIGYLLMDRFAGHRTNQSRSLCGGPTGKLRVGSSDHDGRGIGHRPGAGHWHELSLV